MKPIDFVKEYRGFAKQSEQVTGINYAFTLAQAALESGWGEHAPGYNFFGIKSFKETDNRQLLRTTEISSKGNLVFPKIISITKTGSGKWKYVVMDWFMSYDSPARSFTDHSLFFFENKRYQPALLVKDDPEAFAHAIAEAGYATDPDYAKKLCSIIKRIESFA